jgi:hypothetical protein
MIKIAGSARRTFIFPADLPTAFAYYSDVDRVLTYLPHISLVRAYAYDKFRILYSTIELGMYHVRIFCDLRTTLNGDKQQALRITPLDNVPPVKPEASLNSITAPGHYSSASVFYAAGDKTRIDYSMTLQAKLPTPLGLRLMPGTVLDSVAGSITESRIHEIASGFIERSIDAFPYWLEEIQQPKRRRKAT